MHMFFHDWTALLRVVVVGPLAYCGLVLMLRISGKRTLAKLNAFDLVVTVALGSTLATILLSKSVGLAEGLLGFFTLIALQYVVAFVSVRSDRFSDLVKSEPTLLLHKGRPLEHAMLEQRVTHGELLAALRSQGVGSLDGIAAVVLETDGSFSIVRDQSGDDRPGTLDAITRSSSEQIVGRQR